MAALSPAPWTAQPDGVITDAAGGMVAVVGNPFDKTTDQDRTNAAAIGALPELVGALEEIVGLASRPAGWTEVPEPMRDLDAIAERARAALARARGEDR